MNDVSAPKAQALPRKHGIMLRLIAIFLAVALAVGLQAGEGKAASHSGHSPVPSPTAPLVDCAPPVALKHPALPVAAQPRDARSSDDSRGCKRAARSGS